jgi:hypothetical protein
MIFSHKLPQRLLKPTQIIEQPCLLHAFMCIYVFGALVKGVKKAPKKNQKSFATWAHVSCMNLIWSG